MRIVKAVIKILPALFFLTATAQEEIFVLPREKQDTRWVSPENPTGEKGGGGKVNKGAKGSAFFTIAPGEKKIIYDQKGAGIINRIWISGTIPITPQQRRSVKLDMFWDNSSKPAISAPIGDFLGIGLGAMTAFENDFFASPEGRSFNSTIPMPYRTAGKIELTNESKSYVLLWYDINFTKLANLPADAMYLHAYWSRNPKTTVGKDFEILPPVSGKGRYIGTNVGVIADSVYQHSWFGEGEVKIFLDGDKLLPTLAGTGTEDYIGTGWGQGKFQGPYHGSLVSDTKNDLFAFYRYHTHDPVYFYQDCKVTLQQIGNMGWPALKKLIERKVPLQPVWYFDGRGVNDTSGIRSNGPQEERILDEPGFDLKNIPETAGVNYYRSDDVSATAYFYLDKPSTNLPALPGLALRMKDVLEREITKN